MQDQISHPGLVKALCKDGGAIKQEMTAMNAHRLHMCLGIAGEAGEVVDVVKKAIIYEKPIDIVDLMKEMGDLEFYLEGLRQSYGINREDVLELNIEKLSKRYAGLTFNNDAAINQADKE